MLTVLIDYCQKVRVCADEADNIDLLSIVQAKLSHVSGLFLPARVRFRTSNRLDVLNRI